MECQPAVFSNGGHHTALADLKSNIATRANRRVEHDLRCRDACPTTLDSECDSECDLQSETSHERSLDDCSAKYLTSKSLQPSPVNLGRRRLVERDARAGERRFSPRQAQEARRNHKESHGWIRHRTDVNG